MLQAPAGKDNWQRDPEKDGWEGEDRAGSRSNAVRPRFFSAGISLRLT
jgi:hypothetical protein